MNFPRHAADAHFATPQPTSFLRHLVESLVLLALAVTLFRCFAAEGYMISTGSMAPGLLGYHRRIICPDCRYLFARGAAFDPDEGTSVETARADFDESSSGFPQTCCPNCGRLDIAAWQIPRNEGDQLLVHKFAYEFRDPRRWEVIVFRNPADPRQAYVKRVAGLPNESITISDGEVYADTVLCRKPLEIQRATRMLVADFSHRPPYDDPDSRSRWMMTDDSGWIPTATGCAYRNPGNDSAGRLEYRHWIRHGGRHSTSVFLSRWPDGVELPDSNLENLAYQSGRLCCLGTFSDLDLNRWKTRTDDPDFHRALQDLFDRSHVAPVTDDYGYNAPESSGSSFVNDFMVAFRLMHQGGEGTLEIELDAGCEQFQTVLDFAGGTVRLIRRGNAEIVRSARLPDAKGSGTYDVEFSCFDAQAVVAVNGRELFDPYLFERSSPLTPVRSPLRLNASGIDCAVDNLKLYRDVYYTSRPDATRREFSLGPGSFFVLGDNSPVSVDSRVWNDPRVPREAFIGKPLVVHLPSRQAHWDWNGSSRFVRVPDVSRIRVVK